MRRRLLACCTTSADLLRGSPGSSPGSHLRGCESFDLGDFRHESNQGLSTTGICENRKDSQPLRVTITPRLRSAAPACGGSGRSRARGGGAPAAGGGKLATPGRDPGGGG